MRVWIARRKVTGNATPKLGLGRFEVVPSVICNAELPGFESRYRSLSTPRLGFLPFGLKDQMAYAWRQPILACLGVEKHRIRYPDAVFYEAWSIADSNR